MLKGGVYIPPIPHMEYRLMRSNSAPRGRVFGLAALFALFVAPFAGTAQEVDPSPPVEGIDYAVYESDGDDSSFADLLKALDKADAVLVGEQHDDMVGHGFQAELLSAATRRFAEGTEDARPVVLSLEMFERDVQYIVDEYLEGLISEDHFLRSARPWDFYEERYRPMVEYAREHHLPIVAANAPRRYVNRVTREGPGSLEVLSEEARSYLPPLPFPGPSDDYRAEWDALFESMMPPPDTTGAEPAPRHQPNPNSLHSQALWDAAMGESVARELEATEDALVLHMVGSFHVQNGTGIPERLAEYLPDARQLIVVMLKVDDVREWDSDEFKDLGDYVILTQKPATTERPVSD